jgi:hypothetical protein
MTNQEIDAMFSRVRENITNNLDNGGDGCTSRIVNEAKYSIGDLLDVESVEIDGEIYTIED